MGQFIRNHRELLLTEGGGDEKKASPGMLARPRDFGDRNWRASYSGYSRQGERSPHVAAINSAFLTRR